MGKLWKQDMICGIANRELTPELCFAIGKSITKVLAQHLEHRPRILIADDSRLSGAMLECALVAGILSVGGEAITPGIIPTPAVAYLTPYYHTDAGISITGADRLFEWNGLKFFDHDGFPLSNDLKSEVERLVFAPPAANSTPLTGADIGFRTNIHVAEDDYIQFLKDTAQCTNFTGMTVVIDCADGATSGVAPFLLKNLGAEVYPLHIKPNGRNISQLPEPTNWQAVQSFMDELRRNGKRADIGFAWDADGCRMRVVDETGTPVHSDAILGLFALHYQKRGILNANSIVAPPTTNTGMIQTLHHHQIQCIPSHTEMHFILDQMRRGNYILGGESSGQLVCLDHTTVSDGLFNALYLLAMLKESRLTLRELVSQIHIFPQATRKVKATEEQKVEFRYHEDIIAHLNALNAKYKEYGRVQVRPSETEPCIHIVIEGPNEQEILADANAMTQVIADRLS